MDLDRFVTSESRYEIRFKANPETLEFLRQRKIFFGRIDDLASDREIIFPKYAKVEEYVNFPHRRLFTCGAFSYCETPWLPLGITVGRYCSIAFGLHIFGVRHPTEWVTQSSIVYDFRANDGYASFVAAHDDLMDNRFLPQIPVRHELPPPTIMHDVWIGQNVQIARGITIGTGSVLAAGSVVTRDVAPYSIVAGVPARLVRMRFEADLVARLLASQWWTYHPKVLFELGYTDPAQFVQGLEDAVRERRVTRFESKATTWSHVLDALLGQTTFEMNSDVTNATFLGTGWSLPEFDFTWALGSSSHIAIPGALARASSKVSFDLFPVVYRAQRVKLNVVKDGRLLFATDFIAVSDGERISVPLKPEWIADPEPLTIEIEHPDAVSPVAIGASEDVRELSVAIRRLIFHP